MKKILVDQSLLQAILECRDNIFGLPWRYARKLKKALRQSLPSSAEYAEIYEQRPIWTYSGSYGLGAATLANKNSCIQKVLVDRSFIHELLEQQYAFFGYKNSVTTRLCQILEKGMVTPYDYTKFYNEP